MRAGLIIGGIFLMLLGLFFDLTLIGLVIGLPIGIIGFIMLLVGLFTSGKSSQIIVTQQVSRNSKSDDNLNLLKRRLAKGEITKKEYEELRKEIEG